MQNSADGSSDVHLSGASTFPRHWVYDAGGRLAEKSGVTDEDTWLRHSFGQRTPWGDAGCVLPSDFPWDSGIPDFVADEACQCVTIPQIFHCFEEDGPRCFSWACPPAVNRDDGGYRYDTPDGGLLCLC